MRILIIYPGHTFSTIDVAEGYLHALEQLGHCVEIYEYHAAIHFYKTCIDFYKENFEPGFGTYSDAFMVLASEHAVIECIDFVPDVILIVTGFMLHRRAFELFHRLDVPVALLLTESPYLDENHAVIMEKGHVSVAFTNDKSSVPYLEQESGVRAVYLPHSYVREKHRPRTGLPEKYKTDVFFYGTLYPERIPLLEPLMDLPYDVHVGGVFIEDAGTVNLNPIDNLEMAYWYNSTKIAINHNRTIIGADCDGNLRHVKRGQAYSIGPRAYEIAACGAFQLCDNTRPELTELFGESVATYEDKEDLLEKVRYYMQNEDEREAMAKEALARVQGCSFVDRAEQILIPALEEI